MFSDDFETLLKSTYEEVRKLAHDKTANANLARSVDSNFMPRAVVLTRSAGYLAHLESIRLRRDYWPILAMLLTWVAVTEGPLPTKSLLCYILLLILKYKIAPSIQRLQPGLSLPFIETIGSKLLFKPEQHSLTLHENLSQIKQLAAAICTQTRTTSINYFLKDAIAQAIIAEALPPENQAFDCVILAGLLFTKLAKSKHESIIGIERFVKLNGGLLGHSFIVVNRNLHTSNANDLSTWNNDAYIIDAWYGVFTRVGNIGDRAAFLARYPLLSPHDKTVEGHYSGYNPTAINEYIDAVKRQVEQLNITATHQSNYGFA